MKFLVKWTKEGDMRYISHLDIMRLFQRAIKRKGIRMKYTEGYSPHPKMSIAQPLSLGYTSVGEYFEFESLEDMDPELVRELLDSAMPEGIRMDSCSVLRETKKAVGALITAGDYHVGIRMEDPEGYRKIREAARWFMEQPSVTVQKVQKKSGKIKEIDIRQKVRELEIQQQEGYLLLSLKVDTGSQSNLNPEVLLEKLRERAELSGGDMETMIERVEMYAESAEGTEIPLYFLK